MLTALGKIINAQRRLHPPASWKTHRPRARCSGSARSKAPTKAFRRPARRTQRLQGQFPLRRAPEAVHPRPRLAVRRPLGQCTTQTVSAAWRNHGRNGGQDADDTAFLQTPRRQRRKPDPPHDRGVPAHGRDPFPDPRRRARRQERRTASCPSSRPPAPDDDGLVARSIKPGFFWRERTIRPEDIVARRWTAAAPRPPTPPPPTPRRCSSRRDAACPSILTAVLTHPAPHVRSTRPVRSPQPPVFP